MTDRVRLELVPASGTGETRSAEVESSSVRFLPSGQAEVVKATDLGNVMVLKHENLYLLSDQFGDIHPDSRGLGLYHDDTRILSCAILRVNGFRPAVLQSSAGQNYRDRIQLTNPDVVRDQSAKAQPLVTLARQSLGISRERILAAGGLEERIRVVNYTEQPEPVEVEVELGADDADIFEVRGYPRPKRGQNEPVALAEGRVSFGYRGVDGWVRHTYVAFSEPADTGPSRDEIAGRVRASWRFILPAGGDRGLNWRIWDAEERMPGVHTGVGHLFPVPPPIAIEDGEAAYRDWARGTTGVRTDNEIFDLTLERSIKDLRLLMNGGPEPGERYIAAGVPWFTTLFGRDTIITALQMLAFRPQLARETLDVLGARQATAVEPWRDAEPGKILHELRHGEMVRAGEIPHTPYYGTVDATPLWLILLSATFEWTGDRELLERHWRTAVRCLEWIDRYGDLDGDGFVEYERKSDRGLYNQGWKDSGDSIRDREGRRAELPIALVEVQGYVFDAKVRMAELARVRGELDLAARLEQEAATLRRRFEESFWVPDQRYYAMALDGSKRQVDAISSNPGHCLWSGIVSPERAREVAGRLMGPGLFSGWGIRTYASGQRGYNPIGYHTGTVWPHDNSIIAAGLKRYGFHEHANELIGRILEAAQSFPASRLPELFCGFERDASSGPVPYPVACSPQAWAAGSPFLFLETMLGLRPHADRAELELLRPQLPDWLERVSVSDLRVGDGAVDLVFRRSGAVTSAEVVRKVGDLSVTIRL